MDITPKDAGREFHEGVAEIDDRGARDGFDVDPFFGVGVPDLQAAEPVEEDGEGAEVGVFAEFGGFFGEGLDGVLVLSANGAVLVGRVSEWHCVR